MENNKKKLIKKFNLVKQGKLNPEDIELSF